MLWFLNLRNDCTLMTRSQQIKTDLILLSAKICFNPRHLCAIFLLFSISTLSQPAFRNSNLSIEERTNDLLKQLTLEEKISLLGYRSKTVERFNIPAYNWWNEALHGVARAGKATVFPQAIGMAASFNTELMHDVADAISTEARAKYNLAVAKNIRSQYLGLTFWSPNINIFRDPRWGRGQETYGEDPYLTSQMGIAFVNGIQGDDKNYLKASACAKHFAVHSGPEEGRHSFNAIVDEKDLRETYLYAFKKLVDGGVESIMCAYNRVNNEPCCTGNTLLQKILRQEWNFKGHVVTDCWALEDIWSRHKVLPNSIEVAVAAIKAGVNLDCSNMLQDDVMKSIQQKLLTEKEIDSALAGILRTQIKLGFYDDGGIKKYALYGEDSIENAYHVELARKMARESMVLLKNNPHPRPLSEGEGRLLPLDKNKIQSIMIVGPNAASLDALLGNYHGVSSKAVNFVEGITGAIGGGIRMEYAMGCDNYDTSHFGGIWAAGNSDVTIAVIGMTPIYEGEEGDAFLSSGDKKNLSLPASHVAYIKALRKANNKPIVAVITAGSALDISSIEPYVNAIIYAWYPGEQGGNALADILFGNYSPSGKLPVTFYKSANDIPAFDNYNMQNRTYRYYNGEVLFPFGFGLSYTTFNYEWKQKPVLKNDTIQFAVSIKNTGNFDAEETIQVYIKYPELERMPLKELKSFKKVFITKGNSAIVQFNIPVNELKRWDLKTGKWKLFKGDYTFFAGNNSMDERIIYRLPIKN